MKNNIHKFFVLCVLLFTAHACSRQPQVMMSNDGSYQLTVPGNWSKQIDLNKDATLQAANLREELYVVVIKEDKSDFPAGTSIDQVVDATRENFTDSTPNAKFSAPLPVTVGGFPAKQFDVSGTVSGIEAKYLSAVVETPKGFYQILSWTLADRYDKSKPKLQQVLNSFKEIK